MILSEIVQLFDAQLAMPVVFLSRISASLEIHISSVSIMSVLLMTT